MCHVGKIYIREYVLLGNHCRAKGMLGKRLLGSCPTLYSATWINGPLYYGYKYRNYTRDSNKVVVLKYLRNSQNSIKSLINEAKKYPLKHEVIQALYEITQNPDTGDFLLVQNNYNLWISKGGFAMVYSANWKNGPLEYDSDEKIYKRNPNRVIALKYLYNSQNISDKFLNEVKKYSINKTSNILNIYGISQNPDTKKYIMVLQYAKEGNFNHWINKNYEHFSWRDKLFALLNIINGLKEIHQKSIVHRNFHTENILFLSEINNFGNCISISDMELCGEVGNIDENKIYGVMPYVAPEVLRRKPSIQESDIFSFGMIMYFVATGRQPFYNRAHDHHLALDIYKGVRPEISEPEAPRGYIDLMKKCWDLNPNNRPNILKVNELIMSFHKSYGMEFFVVENEEIGMQFKKAEEYRKANLSSIKIYQIETHPQAIYTSRLLNPFTEDLPEHDDDNSQCLDQVI
ncbi:unnamed protein product [Rhizophagus irregularis]|nr:unnamed protein product [Rhizophagus irregularis]